METIDTIESMHGNSLVVMAHECGVEVLVRYREHRSASLSLSLAHAEQLALALVRATKKAAERMTTAWHAGTPITGRCDAIVVMEMSRRCSLPLGHDGWHEARDPYAMSIRWTTNKKDQLEGVEVGPAHHCGALLWAVGLITFDPPLRCAREGGHVDHHRTEDDRVRWPRDHGGIGKDKSASR